MTYETKFKLGQQVFMISGDRVYEKCESCEGTGKIEVSQMDTGRRFKILCDDCRGLGKKTIKDKKHYYVVEKYPYGISGLRTVKIDYAVSEIRINEYGVFYTLDPLKIKADFPVHDKHKLQIRVKEEELFGSLEEAQEYCDKMNTLY